MRCRPESRPQCPTARRLHEYFTSNQSGTVIQPQPGLTAGATLRDTAVGAQARPSRTVHGHRGPGLYTQKKRRHYIGPVRRGYFNAVGFLPASP